MWLAYFAVEEVYIRSQGTLPGRDSKVRLHKESVCPCLWKRRGAEYPTQAFLPTSWSCFSLQTGQTLGSGTSQGLTAAPKEALCKSVCCLFAQILLYPWRRLLKLNMTMLVMTSPDISTASQTMDSQIFYFWLQPFWLETSFPTGCPGVSCAPETTLNSAGLSSYQFPFHLLYTHCTMV